MLKEVFNEIMVIFKKVIKQPVDGVSEIFSTKKESNFNLSMVLISLTGFIYFIIPYLIFILNTEGYMRRSVKIKFFIFIGIVVIIYLLCISIFTFLVKSIKGFRNFKQELFTGALSGIPMLLFIMLYCFFSLFSETLPTLIGPFNFKTILEIGIYLFVVIFYLLLVTSNIIYQSIVSSNINANLSWYISPLVLFLSFYVSYKIAFVIFD